MVFKRFMSALLVISLMLSVFALAGGDNGDGVCLVSEKADYKELKSQFSDFEDDFFQYKTEYRNAIFEKDDSQLNKYSYKMDNLDGDLRDLRDDVRSLTSDVEDTDSCTGKSDLLDDLDNLKQDISDVREKISDLQTEQKMVEKNAAVKQQYATEPTPSPSVAAKNTEFVVNSLGSGPKTSTPTPALTATVTVEKTAPSWEQTRQTAWLIAGLIVLAAVVLFLLGMLFR